MEPTKEWLVSCRDVAGKRRDMSVSVQDGNIVVAAPPGDAAAFAPLEVGKLRAALRAAAMAAGTTSADARDFR